MVHKWFINAQYMVIIWSMMLHKGNILGGSIVIGYPHSWMVFVRENPNLGWWLGVPPWLWNPSHEMMGIRNFVLFTHCQKPSRSTPKHPIGIPNFINLYWGCFMALALPRRLVDGRPVDTRRMSGILGGKKPRRIQPLGPLSWQSAKKWSLGLLNG